MSGGKRVTQGCPQPSALRRAVSLVFIALIALVAAGAAVADYSSTPLYTSPDSAIDAFFARNLSSSAKSIGGYLVPVESGAQATEYANLIAAHSTRSITALTELYDASATLGNVARRMGR
jgi:hypothetical protein